MKHLLIIPLALALIIPSFAFGQENTGDTPVTNVAPPTNQPTGIPGIQPPKTDAPKPLPQQNMVPGMTPGAPTGAPREIRPIQGSSTNPVMPVRPLAPQGMGEGVPRPNLGSTTKPFMAQPRATFAPDMKQAILERPQDFATATKAIVMERRALFASSTAAKALEARRERIGEFGSTTRPMPGPRPEHFGSTTIRDAALTEDMKARILAHAEHAAGLLDAMLGRLAGIAERIAGRIEALEDAGVDASLAEAELAEAYDAIENAGTVIEGVKAAIEEALESETPRDMLEGAKAAGDAAKEALRAAHVALQEAAQALPKASAPVPAEIINQ